MYSVRITKALLDDHDLKANHKRVYRIMKQLNIQGEGYRKNNVSMILLKVRG
ncbi:MAG: transposase [Bacillota bacterium]|nr:transposase [Bacillota bacterium]